MSDSKTWWKQKVEQFTRWVGRLLRRLFSGEWMGETDLSRISAFIFWSIVVACIVAAADFQTLLCALAALMCGLLLGFLFGIPRVQQSPSSPNPVGREQSNGYQLRVNTNLEEISDWLTKIIVGVSLVQLGKIPEMFESVVDYVAICGRSRGSISTILILFTILGFFAGYLMTRVFLSAAFSRADQLAESFSRGLEQARSEFGDRRPATAAIRPSEEEISKYRDLALLSPRSAVLEAWFDLVRIGRDALRARQIEPPTSDFDVIQRVSEVASLSPSEIGILFELRQLRNLAAHSEEHGITARGATDYAILAMRIAHQIVESDKKAALPAEEPIQDS